MIWGTGKVILFASVRRRNGFAGLHELATRTRVIVRVDVVPAEVPAAEHSREAPIPAHGKIGPYAVRGTLREDGDERLLLGFDEMLRRPVLIVFSAPCTPAVPDARRDLAREGRLLVAGRVPRRAGRLGRLRSGRGRAARGRAPGAALLGHSQAVAARSCRGIEERPPREPSVATLALLRGSACSKSRSGARLLDSSGAARASDGPSQPALGGSGRDLASAQAFLAALGEAAARPPLPLHAAAFLRSFGAAGYASFDDLRAAAAMLQVRPAAVLARAPRAQLLLYVAPVRPVPRHGSFDTDCGPGRGGDGAGGRRGLERLEFPYPPHGLRGASAPTKRVIASRSTSSAGTGPRFPTMRSRSCRRQCGVRWTRVG